MASSTRESGRVRQRCAPLRDGRTGETALPRNTPRSSQHPPRAARAVSAAGRSSGCGPDTPVRPWTSYRRRALVQAK